MKKAVAAVLVLVLVFVTWRYWGVRSTTTESPAPPGTAAVLATAKSTSASPPPGVSAGEPVASADASTQAGQGAVPVNTPVPTAPSAPDAAETSALPPSTILDNARVAVHNYNAVYGENPVGENSEITAALRGKNPKHVNFIADDSGLRVNAQGELIDAWGTPFFFHQLSGQVMEIRSAGADRKMWTYDDLVTR